jgi:hypothetical protein
MDRKVGLEDLEAMQGEKNVFSFRELIRRHAACNQPPLNELYVNNC